MIKLFKVYKYASFRSFYVFEVDRDLEFSPLKNADEVGVDCPSTCIRDLARVHALRLSKVGIQTEKPVYISPLSTYEEENLEKGKVQGALQKLSGNWLSLG
jgi:UDP-N-acetylglucosamine/UDP-N-acetylgalactosamine diphosphorylase